MSKLKTTDTNEVIQPEEKVTIELEMPTDKDMPVGRLDTILETLIKKEKVTKISKKIQSSK